MRTQLSRLIGLVCFLAFVQNLVAKEPSPGWGSEWKSSANLSDGALLLNVVEQLVREKHYDKALELIERALQENPHHPFLDAMRAKVFSAKGEHRKAIALYSEILNRKELHKELRAAIQTGRGFALYRTQNYRDSLADHLRALALAPTALRHNNVAWSLATCPDASVRDGKKAIKEATIAVREATDDATKSACLDTLAAAYAEVGDFPSAIQWQTKALALATSPVMRQSALQHMKFYQNNQPFRQSPDEI